MSRRIIMENDDVTAVYEKTTPSLPPPVEQNQQFPLKAAIAVLLLFTVAMISGMGWILYNRTTKSPRSPQPTAVKASPSPQPIVDQYSPPDYTNFFTFTVPEGYATLKGYTSESLGRAIVALKAPEEAGFNDPIIRFNIAEKEADVSLEKFAYNPDLCDPNSDIGENCGGRYNPPYEDKEITVDGKKALWQRYDSIPAGDRLVVYIEKSPTEAVVISSFTHEDATESSKLDERIVPVFEKILETFHFVE
jgi:hypothetical protein